MLSKKFLKMDRDEQEQYLVEKLGKLYGEIETFRKILAQVRGKQKFTLTEIDRPDLYDLKGQD
jgi:hypothetical protein